MKTYDHIAIKIIKAQELLMGPVAWYEAGKVKGLQVIDKTKGTILIGEDADGLKVVDSLVNQYANLFGRAAREVCREAAAVLVADLSPSEVPSSLR